MRFFVQALPWLVGLVFMTPACADTAQPETPGLCDAFYRDKKIDPLPVEYFTRERAIKAATTLTRILKGALKDPDGDDWDEAVVTLRAWHKRERLIQELTKPASPKQNRKVRIYTEEFCMFVDDEAYDFDWPGDRH